MTAPRTIADLRGTAPAVAQGTTETAAPEPGWLPGPASDEQISTWLAADAVLLDLTARSRVAKLLGQITDAFVELAAAEVMQPLADMQRIADGAAAMVDPAAATADDTARALARVDAEIAEARQRVADYSGALDAGASDATVLAGLAEKLHAAQAALAVLQQRRAAPAAAADQAQALLRDVKATAAQAARQLQVQRDKLRDPLHPHNAPQAHQRWMLMVYPALFVAVASGARVSEQHLDAAMTVHRIADEVGGIQATVEGLARAEAKRYMASQQRALALGDGYVLTPGGSAIARLAGH